MFYSRFKTAIFNIQMSLHALKTHLLKYVSSISTGTVTFLQLRNILLSKRSDKWFRFMKTNIYFIKQPGRSAQISEASGLKEWSGVSWGVSQDPFRRVYKAKTFPITILFSIVIISMIILRYYLPFSLSKYSMT